MEAYLAYNKDDNIRKKSSSGGIFYECAKYILDNNGIVFGAAWTNEWLVDMIAINNINDLPKLIGSKYVKANNQNTFEECKQYLDNNKLVLYSGTPCQIMSLKKYLDKDYENLYTISIACHGTLPIQIWKDYLESIQRSNITITNINMRSKENTVWENYNIVIEYSDGKKLIESHNDNKYFKAFLSDKYLNTSCYNCIAKTPFKSDISIGDYWGINKQNINKNLGISFILINTNKGNILIDILKDNLTLTKDNYDYIYNHNAGLHSIINKQKEKYSKTIFRKNVAIITMHIHSNYGGCLQAYALQKTIKDLGYNCVTFNYKCDNMLPFINKYINTRLFDKSLDYKNINKNDYDIFVVGSDQIWRNNFSKGDFPNNNIYFPFLCFTKNWNKVRFSYAASVGVEGNEWEYNEIENKQLTNILNQFNNISVREIGSVKDFKEKLNIEAYQHIDPTLLLKKEDYLNICKNVHPKQLDVFAYILDNNTEKENSIKNFCSNKNLENLIINTNTIEEWLANFRDSKYIITNSFHGCIFAIIFNKPFICIGKSWRGNARFNSLTKLFNLKILDSFDDLNTKEINFNITNNKDIKFLKEKSISYLKNMLSDTPKVLNTDIEFISDKPAKKIKTITKTNNKNNSYLYF